MLCMRFSRMGLHRRCWCSCGLCMLCGWLQFKDLFREHYALLLSRRLLQVCSVQSCPLFLVEGGSSVKFFGYPRMSHPRPLPY